MRISQLSAESGVPIPTIKYYLREGLLPQGEQTSATRAEYGQTHLRRLRLIRALLEVGRLPIAAIRDVLDAVDDETLGVHKMLGTAHYALSPGVEPHEDTPDWQEAREMVDQLITDFDWQIEPEAPAREELAQTIVTLRHLDAEPTLADLTPYATAAQTLVQTHEMHKIPFDAPREITVEAHIIGTVMYGRVLDTIRRLAQESESARILTT
ncbi:transcriptional regulator [Acrocarpospora pleiomorpha]|uniref:Transcriptional regulator n=1 Tax=Acrocarpospora pleiomorpha TaxID=90975 RepID=A0A5M3XWP5_9ACTN|nr:MerR family transcriptional regulator [Acrocarpospora pleiomorpha]GES22708.1 transcriptional regulator [Acrocarpospora pleiomorpha]